MVTTIDKSMTWDVGVSKNRGKTPQIIHFNRVSPYKPSILGGFPPIFGNTHVPWQPPGNAQVLPYAFQLPSLAFSKMPTAALAEGGLRKGMGRLVSDGKGGRKISKNSVGHVVICHLWIYIFFLEGIVVKIESMPVSGRIQYVFGELSSFRSYQLKWFVRLNHTNPKMKSIIFQSGSRRLCFSNRNSSLIQWNCPMDVAKASCHFRLGGGTRSISNSFVWLALVFEKIHIIYLDYLACDVDIFPFLSLICAYC